MRPSGIFVIWGITMDKKQNLIEDIFYGNLDPSMHGPAVGSEYRKRYPQTLRRHWLSRPSLFQKFRKLCNFMAILPITDKDASWSVKLDHEASFCNFPQDVGIVGGGEGS